MRRFLLGDQLDQSCGEAEDGRGVKTLASIYGAANEGEVRTIGECHAVEEVERFHVLIRNQNYKISGAIFFK